MFYLGHYAQIVLFHKSQSRVSLNSSEQSSKWGTSSEVRPSGLQFKHTVSYFTFTFVIVYIPEKKFYSVSHYLSVAVGFLDNELNVE